jgi:Zn-dependent protease with chaperone function
MKLNIFSTTIIIGLLWLGYSCGKKETPPPTSPTGKNCLENVKGSKFNLFSVQKDVDLGAQTEIEILSNPKEYPLLDSATYPNQYKFLYAMRDEILNSGQLTYKNEFKWKLKIIHDDSTLNAFCTPGGYIFVYTGLIKYLDTEDQLAGVLGHEIAHADKRHSTEAMTKQYPILITTGVLGLGQSQLANIVASMIGLKYSRDNESEADAYSVVYLSKTKYKCSAGGGFFEKLIKDGMDPCGSNPLAKYTSTHPCPDNRVQNFNTIGSCYECIGRETGTSAYNAFKNGIPKSN